MHEGANLQSFRLPTISCKCISDFKLLMLVHPFDGTIERQISAYGSINDSM
jgi:hypothetical protein